MNGWIYITICLGRFADTSENLSMQTGKPVIMSDVSHKLVVDPLNEREI